MINMSGLKIKEDSKYVFYNYFYIFIDIIYRWILHSLHLMYRWILQFLANVDDMKFFSILSDNFSTIFVIIKLFLIEE